jgi:hypothetical protein
MVSSSRGYVISKDDLSGFISRAKDGAKHMWPSQSPCRTGVDAVSAEPRAPKLSRMIVVNPLIKVHKFSFLKLRLWRCEYAIAFSFLLAGMKSYSTGTDLQASLKPICG